jgi:hypothetical protein
MAELQKQHAQILWIDDQEPPVQFENVFWVHPDGLIRT